MAIDEAEVRHLERLAALRLGDDERRRLTAHLARIVAYVEQLRALDLPGGEPPAPPEEPAAPRRPDLPRDSLPRADALAAAPASEEGLFVVPPVFGAEAHGEARPEGGRHA